MNKEQQIAISAIEAAMTNAGKKVVNYFGIMIFAGMVLSTGYQLATGGFDRDDTDGSERSGLKLHTDHGTGCQYLSTIGGGITPRVSADGATHYGCKGSYK